MSGKYICKIANSPLAVMTLMREQIIAAIQAGHRVLVITKMDDEVVSFCREVGAEYRSIPIVREISFVQDLKALAVLIGILRQVRVDIIHSCTPKAGLLSAIAGFIARVPLRFHTFTGQRWLTLSGFRRSILKFSDWLIVCLNTECYADSQSQVALLEAHGLVRKNRIKVLGHGSFHGVDLRRFDERLNHFHRDRIRKELNVPESTVVIIFVGRITVDKGIRELAEAFLKMAKYRESIVLLLVGNVESNGHSELAVIMQTLQKHPMVRRVPFQAHPEHFFAASDMLAIPSYREGFPNVVIEAAAMGLPSIGFEVTGLVDSVVHGQTGLLVPVRDTISLESALDRLVVDEKLRVRMGRAAQERVYRHFSMEYVNGLIIDEYQKISDKMKQSSLDEA